MLANYEVEHGNAGNSDTSEADWVEKSCPWRERLNDMHLLFPSHVWRLSLCKLKRQSVSVPRSGVCLSFLTNACLPLWGFWALYDSFVCICIWHLSTFHCRHNNSDTVIMLSECSTFKLSILHGFPGNKQMIQWCVDDANVTSAGSWLTGAVGSFDWLSWQWYRDGEWNPLLAATPSDGAKGKATPDPYMSWSVLGPDGFSCPADRPLHREVGQEISFQQYCKNQDKMSFHTS